MPLGTFRFAKLPQYCSLSGVQCECCIVVGDNTEANPAHHCPFHLLRTLRHGMHQQLHGLREFSRNCQMKSLIHVDRKQHCYQLAVVVDF